MILKIPSNPNSGIPGLCTCFTQRAQNEFQRSRRLLGHGVFPRNSEENRLDLPQNGSPAPAGFIPLSDLLKGFPFHIPQVWNIRARKSRGIPRKQLWLPARKVGRVKGSSQTAKLNFPTFWDESGAGKCKECSFSSPLEALKLPEVISLFPIPWKWKTVAGKLQEHREVFLKISGFAPSSVQIIHRNFPCGFSCLLAPLLSHIPN